MNEQVPSWLTNLASEIYKIIKQYDAMSRFRDMVEAWAKSHEEEIEKNNEWDEQRRLHFEQKVSNNQRLQDDQEGPPAEGWQFEHHIQIYTGTRYKRINGWVPPELSISKRPKTTRLLPLSRDHILTLEEKYTLSAAIYDSGRRGTDKIPPWEWPDLNIELSPDKLSDAKKSIFFEGLSRQILIIPQSDEAWLRTFINDVEKDLCDWRNIEPATSHNGAPTLSSETRIDRWVRKAKDHPLISVVIFVVIVIAGLGLFTDNLSKIVTFYYWVTNQHDETKVQMKIPTKKNVNEFEEDVKKSEDAISHVSLTIEQQNQLVEELSFKSNFQIVVACRAFDQESYNSAEQIADIFKKARWQIGQINQTYLDDTEGDVAIAITEQRQQKTADRLASILNKFGIDCRKQKIREASIADIQANTIYLIVGTKKHK